MRRLAALMTGLVACAAATTATAQAQPERMFQLMPQAGPACAASLSETGKALVFGETLDAAQREQLMGAIFLTLHSTEGNDQWPQKEVEAASACPIARFAADDLVWTISGGAAGLPLRWARAPGRDEVFFLVQGPALAEAGAWNASGRRGLPAASSKPGYYLVGRMIGVNFIAKLYDGPPSAQVLANDIAAVLELETPPLAVHDAVGDAITLFKPVEGAQAEIFRPQDVLAEDGFAALYLPDDRFFTRNEDGAFVMSGSGFACAKAYGKFERELVGVFDPSPEKLELSCNLKTETGATTVFVMRQPDTSKDKANWAYSIKAYQDETGVYRKLSDPPTGPRTTLQAGKTWISKDGLVVSVFILRRGEYVYQINQEHPAEEMEAGGEAALAILDQIDLSDAKSADGWRARR